MNEKTTENAVALFDYIRKIKEQSRRVITDITKYDKTYDPRALAESDPERIHLYPADSDDVSEEQKPFVLFQVDQPDLHKCPNPPASLRGWLDTGWERTAMEEVEPRKQIPVAAEEGEAVEYFGSNSKRVKDFQMWSAQRAQWRAEEQKRRNTKRIFDDLYSLYQEMRDNVDGMELVAGNGFFRCAKKTEDGALIDHPLLLRKIRLDYEKQRRAIQIIDAGVATEFHDECLKGLDDIPGENQQHVREYIRDTEPHPMGTDIEEVLRNH